VGDAAGVLARLPAASVATVVTSPPYYGLRDYDGVPDQLGHEPTPGEYVSALAAVFDELARVLRPDGAVWVNLGDTYSGRADRATKQHAGRGHRPGISGRQRVNTTAAAPYKSLLLMPARVALALQGRGWIVRNDVVWHKPNAMPSPVTDRLSTRYEHLFLLTRRPAYYFDLDAIRVQASGQKAGNRDRTTYARAVGTAAAARRFGDDPASTLGDKEFHTRNPGDVWSIATRRRPGVEHFAMYPVDIPLRCIAATSRPGDLVLDPFSGTGTTGRAALQLRRRYVGIDLHPKYHDYAVKALARAVTA